MSHSIISTILLAFSLTLVTALPSALEPRSCGTKIAPTNYYGIFSGLPTQTGDQGRFPPAYNLDFFINQDTLQYDDGTSFFRETDLIATFTNIPCSKPPYRLEFHFVPTTSYVYNPANAKVDVFAIDGPLPKNSTGGEAPTYDNMRGRTGAKVGSLNFPRSANPAYQIIEAKNGLACKQSLNFRLSITDEGGRRAGTVRYDQLPGTGLRIRYGC